MTNQTDLLDLLNGQVYQVGKLAFYLPLAQGLIKDGPDEFGFIFADGAITVYVPKADLPAAFVARVEATPVEE